jgi:hypothetical protein
VKFSLEDDRACSVHVPVATNALWQNLAPDLQRITTALWTVSIPSCGREMMAAQGNGERDAAEPWREINQARCRISPMAEQR